MAPKLNAVDVIAIRASDETNVTLAARYGVTSRAIGMARAGRTFKSVPNAQEPRIGGRPATATAHLSDDDVRAIRASAARGVVLAQRFNLTPQTVSKLRLGQLRAAAGGRIWASGHHHGRREGFARLTPADVAAIRAAPEGELPALAQRLKVSWFILHLIRKRRPWKTVTNYGPPRGDLRATPDTAPAPADANRAA